MDTPYINLAMLYIKGYSDISTAELYLQNVWAGKGNDVNRLFKLILLLMRLMSCWRAVAI